MFNVTFIGSNAVFMVGKFIAIDFDSIFVFLNIASICLDVFLILANLSILCVLLTLDGCKTLIHLRIQLAICNFTFRSFLSNSCRISSDIFRVIFCILLGIGINALSYFLKFLIRNFSKYTATEHGGTHQASQNRCR